ncbi:Cation exchanger-like protein [Zostera marina]|uniref:Cation exchanger-like protein n=1 Tax=Zostera marina TaxID=29655 RepID=A0A0K9NXY5_ZOSMR|nr:Cation exchanger-like protein [Zostera marina]
MGLSKTEVNLRRLLDSAPKQQNTAKIIHYITTLREQHEQLEREITREGLTSISKVKLNVYSEKIEALAASLATLKQSDPVESLVAVVTTTNEDNTKEQLSHQEKNSPGLRRRNVSRSNAEDKIRENSEITSPDQAASIKLDASAQAHIEKHRKLQEDITDEMVELARQLKESSLMMNQSIQNTDKILDSTESAVEHSLAGTARVNTRAGEIYSESVKTSCFTWLLMFLMIFVFVMVVLLIRVT